MNIKIIAFLCIYWLYRVSHLVTNTQLCILSPSLPARPPAMCSLLVCLCLPACLRPATKNQNTNNSDAHLYVHWTSSTHNKQQHHDY